MLNSYEINDFLKQLALLTKSDLPLPAALEQLAKETRSKNFKKLLREMSKSTENGKSLSQSMAEQQDSFSPFYIRLVALGEKQGNLSNVLTELAQISKFQYMLVNMIRDVMLYPLVAIGLCVIITLLMSKVVVPPFRKIFHDLLCGEPVPALTYFVLNSADFINMFFYPIIGFLVLIVVYIIFLYTNSRTANRALLKLSRIIPFSEIIFYNFGMARLCAIWAVMMRRKVPSQEVFPVLAELMDTSALVVAVNRVAKRCATGEDAKKCLAEEQDISRLLIIMLQNTKEENLPEELDKLAELYRERASYGFRRVGIAWEIISLSVLVLIASTVILFLFLPFIGLLKVI